MIPGTVAAVNPFPGLRPFEPDETHLFFGRDGQASEIVARLQRQRFLAVVGTSGSGKSSLVRAGLLPMLEGGFMPAASSFWRFAVMRSPQRSDARADRLTQRLLNDAGDDPDALPVLQHALMRTWDAWNAGGTAGPLWRNPDLERALLWERDEHPSSDWATRYGTREEFARAMEFLRASDAAWQEETRRNAEAARLATERELEMRTQHEREARMQAELSELRSRKGLLSSVVVLVPALIAGLVCALVNRAEARSETNKARAALEEANKQTAIAKTERARAQMLLERLTNSNRMKLAFLGGDIETIRRIDQETPVDPRLQFQSRKIPLKTDSGGTLFRWELFPASETLQGPL